MIHKRLNKDQISPSGTYSYYFNKGEDIAYIFRINNAPQNEYCVWGKDYQDFECTICTKIENDKDKDKKLQFTNELKLRIDNLIFRTNHLKSFLSDEINFNFEYHLEISKELYDSTIYFSELIKDIVSYYEKKSEKIQTTYWENDEYDCYPKFVVHHSLLKHDIVDMPEHEIIYQFIDKDSSNIKAFKQGNEPQSPDCVIDQACFSCQVDEKLK